MNNIIQINDKWRIRKVPLNYIPEVWQDAKPIEHGKYAGKTTEAGYYSIERYYGTLPQALKGILRHETDMIAENGASISDLVDKLEKIAEELEQNVKEVMK